MSDMNYVRYLLNNLLISKDYVSFISLYADNGFTHYTASDKSSIIPKFDDIKKTGLYQRAYSLKGYPIWAYIPKTNTDFILNNAGDKITMFKTLFNLNDYSEKGLITISINVGKVREIYKSLLEIKDSVVLLLNEENDVFLYDTSMASDFHPDDVIGHVPKSAYTDPEGSEIYNDGGKQFLLSFVTLKGIDWKIVNIAPLKSFAINLQFVPVIVVLVFVLALFLGFYFTTFTSSLLIKPIKNLLASMNRVKTGNFKEMVKVEYKDEIGELCLHYNEMISYINNLLNQVYALEIGEKIAELKALQAQINPHFLYNTLDTIYWKAMAGDNKGVQQMIHALSKLFRLALNVGKEFFQVRQERELIGYYLLLQEKRYKNKLQYNLNFNLDILYYEIPKLILQPFVENAIVHGIETEDKPTTVDISGFMDGDKIHFIIKDNGAGMPEEVLKKLLDPNIDKNSVPDKGGYGIKNVINRLSLYYEDHYTLDIQSKLGVGTEINILLPAAPVQRKDVKGYA